MRIGNRFKVKTDDSSLLVGKLDGAHWTINGNASRAYIAFGGTTWTEANSDSNDNTKVYLGTDGISLGHRFSVSHQGVVKAYSGEVGGWTLSRRKLTGGNMEINSDGSMKGGSSYAWSITSAGTATFNRIKADVGGTIGNCNINNNGIYSTGWYINADGSASFSNVTITGGSLNIGAASIGTDGYAKFSNIDVTGGKIGLGGTTLNASGTNLTAGKTKVGSKSLQTYVEDLVVGRLTAADVTITASLNVGNSNYYLRMGQGTKNPEVSGLNIGPKGIKMNNGKSGQTHSINFVSSIDDLTVSVHKGSVLGLETPIITSVTVKLDYSTRKISFYDGVHTEITDSSGGAKSDTGN